jgi:hypothetical protein
VKKGDIPLFAELKVKETNEIGDSLQSAKIVWTVQDLGHASSKQHGLRDFRPKQNNLRNKI